MIRCETKQFLTENRDTPTLPRPPPLIHKNFRYQNFCETQKDSPTKMFFGTVKQQSSNRKSWSSPDRHIFFRYPKIMKHWRAPLRNDSLLWEKTILTEKRDTRPLLSLTFFAAKNLLKHRRVPLRNFSALWDKNFSTENLDTPLPLRSVNFIATGSFLNYSNEGFAYEVFRYNETKKFWQKIVILPS